MWYDDILLRCFWVFSVMWSGPTLHSLGCSSSPSAQTERKCLCVWAHTSYVCFNFFLCLPPVLISLCRKAVSSWCQWGTGRYVCVCLCMCSMCLFAAVVQRLSPPPSCLLTCYHRHHVSSLVFSLSASFISPFICHLFVFAHLQRYACLSLQRKGKEVGGRYL